MMPRPLVMTVLVLVAACACGQSSGWSNQHSTASGPPPASTGSTRSAATTLAAWQSRGADTVPPDGVTQVTLGSIAVVNQTGGAVSDGDARAWATALLRSSNYDDWGLNNMQDGFFLRSGLSSVPRTVFAAELRYIQTARASGARVQATPQTIRRLVLRPVPTSMRQQFAAQLMTWSPYAFYVDKTGPSELAYVDGGGTRAVKSQLAAGAAAPESFAGQLLHDDVLGDVWRLDSDYDCGSSASRAQLGGICAP